MTISRNTPRDFPQSLARGVLVLVASLLLAACGGGSSSGSNPGAGTTPPPGQDTSIRLLQVDGTGAGSGSAGTPLGSLPSVRVVDGLGAPVAGVTVSFAVVQGGGQVTPATVLTGADGRAGPQSWVLGTVAGPNALRASIEGAAPRNFSVTGQPGPVSEFQHASPSSQEGSTGQAVAAAPTVLVTDAFGNPVPGVGVNFAVIAGGGSVAAASVQTGTNGLASSGSWTLGPMEGAHQLRATSSGLGELLFSATAGVPLVLSIDSVQINQGSQTLDGQIPAVAGRPGLLRVVVRANRDNSATPPVRVRLSYPGGATEEHSLNAPGNGVPLSPDLGQIASTWNLTLRADQVQPGMAVAAVVDPNETLPLGSRELTRYPREAGEQSLTVHALAPLRVRFVRIDAPHHGRNGNITAANMDQYLVATDLWLPVAGLHAELRTVPFVTDRDLGTSDGISGLLGDLQAVRTAEASPSDWYYHGIFPRIGGTNVAGIAYRPNNASSQFRTALSHDASGAASTVAHELGHNLGRRHSPCGNPDGVDPNYPHDGGVIGAPGFDISANTIRAPGSARDYMGYCNNRWTSDYTYQGILDWRRNDPFAVNADVAFMAADAAAVAAPTPGLLLWGRVSGAGVELNPALSLEAHAVLPDEDGPHRLRGVAADGAVLFELGFAGTEVPHAADADERHFAWFVPLAPGAIAALERVELFSPAGHAERAAPRTRLTAAPEVALLAADGADPDGGVRLHWDAARHPVVMVRDRNSGEILALGRSGELRLPAMMARDVELLLSDGVRSEAALPPSLR